MKEKRHWEIEKMLNIHNMTQHKTSYQSLYSIVESTKVQIRSMVLEKEKKENEEHFIRQTEH